MLDNFKFHHVGYVTDNIEKTSIVYKTFGYTASSIMIDPFQKVKICYLQKELSPRIELVEPIDEKSSVNKILKKTGVTPYHVCWEVDDIDIAFTQLCEKGFIPLFRPIEAAALENRLICYFYKAETGYIEILSKN